MAKAAERDAGAKLARLKALLENGGQASETGMAALVPPPGALVAAAGCGGASEEDLEALEAVWPARVEGRDPRGGEEGARVAGRIDDLEALVEGLRESCPTSTSCRSPRLPRRAARAHTRLDELGGLLEQVEDIGDLLP